MNKFNLYLIVWTMKHGGRSRTSNQRNHGGKKKRTTGQNKHKQTPHHLQSTVGFIWHQIRVTSDLQERHAELFDKDASVCLCVCLRFRERESSREREREFDKRDAAAFDQYAWASLYFNMLSRFWGQRLLNRLYDDHQTSTRGECKIIVFFSFL
jgi:hypothetical protein